MRRPDAARACYVKYLTAFPAGPLVLDAALGAGRAALHGKQYAAALTDLQKALELCATLGQTGELAKRAGDVKPEAKFWLGECYFAQAQAAAALQQSAGASAFALQPWYTVGVYYFAQAQYSEATRQYAAASALALEPWYSRALLQEARCSALTHNTPPPSAP